MGLFPLGLRACAAGALLSISFCAAPLFAGTATIGVIGDSLADEYQFSPDQAAARSFAEILAGRNAGYDFGSFSTVSRGEPRNAGYEFNWAQSGARTSQLRLQVEGLAAQIASGQVKYGMVVIGSTNLRDVLEGANPIRATRGGIANTAAAASALLSASPDFKLAIANVPDITVFPEAKAALAANPRLAPRYDQVRTLIDTYNDSLTFQLAQNPRVTLVDANALFDQLTTGPTVDGITLDPNTPGPALSNLFVDGIHPGTIAQGELADEFLEALGLPESGGGGTTPPPPVDPDPTPPPAPTPIPLPAGAWAALVAMPLVFRAIRKKRVG